MKGLFTHTKSAMTQFLFKDKWKKFWITWILYCVHGKVDPMWHKQAGILQLKSLTSLAVKLPGTYAEEEDTVAERAVW